MNISNDLKFSGIVCRAYCIYGSTWLRCTRRSCNCKKTYSQFGPAFESIVGSVRVARKLESSLALPICRRALKEGSTPTA